MNRKILTGLARPFRTLWESIIRYYHTYGIWELLFFAASAGMALYGLLAQGLACLTDYTGYESFVRVYLLHWLLALCLGGLVYYLVACLSKGHRLFRILATVFLVTVFLFESLAMLFCVAFYDDLLADDEFLWTYEDWTYEDSHHWGMISGSDLIGPGPDDAPYKYHDEVSDREVHPLYPLLSATYGYWILILFALIAVVWLCAAVRIYLKIYSRWHEWLYLMAFLIMAHILITTMLGFTGIIPCVEVCLFTEHWLLISFIPVPQLITMCTVIKWNNEAI